MRKLTRWIIVAGACTALIAGRASAAAPARTLDVDDVIGIEAVEGVDVSPDGQWAAWVKRTTDDKKNEYHYDVYMSRTDGTETIHLTRGGHDRSPRFSPDGGRVAFLRRADKGGTQIYILDLHGGEARRVTHVQAGVQRFAWVDDGALLYSAPEDSTLREHQLRKHKDDAIIVADQEHYGPVRLFTVSVDGKTTHRLTMNPGEVDEFAVSPDHKRVVVGENHSVNYEYDYRKPPQQYLVDLGSGKRREICTAPHVDPYGFKWDAHGDGFYCIRDIASDSTDIFVSIQRLYYYDVAADTLRKVPVDWPRGISGFHVVDDGVVLALCNGVRDRMAHLTVDGRHTRLRTIAVGRPIRIEASQPQGNRIVYLQSDASTIPELRSAVVSNGSLNTPTVIAPFNQRLRSRKLAKTAIVHWAGARGDTVEGILYYPVGYADTTSYPLIVFVHGGPAAHDPDFFSERWANDPHLLAGKGALVLKVNYHGSSNYGLKWVESIRSHYYDLEVPDILRGVDYLVATGIADSTRVGIMGWSNGSILSIACCVKAPHRFKALCAGAGEVDWISDYGNCAFGASFDNAYFGGPPWKLKQVYADKSPLFDLEVVRTPTLIMFGTKDTNVPVNEGWEHFRALQQIGKAPARFILFPGEPHGLRKPSHQRRKMNEEIAWLDRYLFGKPPAGNEALDKKSLLALRLQQQSIARVGSLAGREVAAAIVPEIVTLQGIDVSRFEITRAQYAAFDPNYNYKPATDNKPVTDISLTLAQAYCLWLSRKTGETYRLPTATEMDTLLAAAKASGAEENTIVHWVGYSPTPDEMKMLQPEIAKLEKTRLLLEPVGSFDPVGKAGVYDLDGNAAEWTTGPGGEGVIKGHSAVSVTDPRAPERHPPLAYVGFRVVRERR